MLFVSFVVKLSIPMHLCQTSTVNTEPQQRENDIDETLLDCFLELTLKQRIQTAANYANAIAKLRRLRPAGASKPVE